MNSSFIGAGRLGKNIALALSRANISPIVTICNQSPESAKQACMEIGSGVPVTNIAQLKKVEILWITCPDDAIESVVKQLTHLQSGSIVIHCSGVLNSSILQPLKAQGCFVASFHPLKAFRGGYLDAHAFNGVFCVLEGDEEACTWLNSAFSRLGAQTIKINPKAKASYHAAATMASNYLITLAACSEALLLESGLEPLQARQMICQLMTGNINNIAQTNTIAQALTGPLMRGDLQTLTLHLQAIKNQETKALYKAAGLATLPLTSLNVETKQAIEQLLGNSYPE